MAAVGGEGIATETMMEIDSDETETTQTSIGDQFEMLTQMKEDKGYKEDLKKDE